MILRSSLLPHVMAEQASLRNATMGRNLQGLNSVPILSVFSLRQCYRKHSRPGTTAGRSRAPALSCPPACSRAASTASTRTGARRAKMLLLHRWQQHGFYQATRQSTTGSVTRPEDDAGARTRKPAETAAS